MPFNTEGRIMIFLSLFRDKIYFKFKFCIKLQENNANLHYTDFKITQLVHTMITLWIEE